MPSLLFACFSVNSIKGVKNIWINNCYFFILWAVVSKYTIVLILTLRSPSIHNSKFSHSNVMVLLRYFVNIVCWLVVIVLQGTFFKSCPHGLSLSCSLLKCSVSQSQVFVEGARLQLAATPHVTQLHVGLLITLVRCFFLLKRGGRNKYGRQIKVRQV